MAAALALVGCAQTADLTAPPPAPSTSAAVVAPTPSGVAWAEDLAFSGELSGHMTGIVPNQPGQRSECTGPSSKTAGNWASTFFGQVANGVYGVVVTADPYRGPGSYTTGLAKIEVHSADQSKVWQTQAGDTVTFTVANDEQSGTLNAVLTNLADGKTKLTIAGHWSCRA